MEDMEAENEVPCVKSIVKKRMDTLKNNKPQCALCTNAIKSQHDSVYEAIVGLCSKISGLTTSLANTTVERDNLIARVNILTDETKSQKAMLHVLQPEENTGLKDFPDFQEYGLDEYDLTVRRDANKCCDHACERDAHGEHVTYYYNL